MRIYLITLEVLLALLAAQPICSRAADLDDLKTRATVIHQRAIVIDGHNDLAWEMREQGRSSFDVLDIAHSVPQLQTDIRRLRAGGVGAQFWSAFVPADTLNKGTAVRLTFEQIDLIHRMVERYPETFEFALTAQAIRTAHAHGKIACLIGVEGGHSIDNSLGVLRDYFRLGVRYMTLTHSDTIEWADSSTDEARNGGLSDFGREVVKEMNRLGMLVDISHTSDDTVRDALEVSRAPLIASHSSARAVANHVRNLPDDLLKQIGQKGGIVMVNFFSGFVTPEAAAYFADLLQEDRRLHLQYPNDAEYKKVHDALREQRKQDLASKGLNTGTVSNVVDHIDHIVRVAGVDHVGLGGDYDGVSLLPKGLEDVSSYPRITEELLRRGYSEKDIIKILGENLLRVMDQAEEVAKDLK